MASSYTTNKQIEKPANGDYNNTWSVPVNSDWDIIDRAFGGTTSLNAVGASGTVTLTSTQYQAPIIGITGALTANVNYQLPVSVGGFFYIFNNTSGAFSITFSSAGGGTTVTLPQGYIVSVISDGTNIRFGTTNAALITSTYADPSWITSLAASKLTGTVAVASGGTGASTSATARVNLLPSYTGNAGKILALNVGATDTEWVSAGGTGTVTSVAMSVPAFLTVTGSPITASGTLAVTLSGTALPIANGGTGATSGAAALSALGGVTTTGTGATGTWAISISGTAATATLATTATTATTANALNTSNNYQVNSLGVGTAGSGTAGEIRATNNVTAYYSSDARLKENVADIESALDKVCAIGGKTFDWIDEYIEEHGGEDEYFLRKSDFGVIAQDVEAVFPVAVRKRDDGKLAVDYEKLVAVAFQAIKELKAEVEALKK